MKQKAETHRIQTGGTGFGEAGDDLIRERAADLARLNGRSEPNEHDLEGARRELREPVRADLTEAETTEAERPGRGTPASSRGSQTPRLLPDDEEVVADGLTHEGIAEADRETRVQSAARVEEH